MRDGWFRRTESYLYQYILWSSQVRAWFVQWAVEHEDILPPMTSSFWTKIAEYQGELPQMVHSDRSTTEMFGIKRADWQSAMPKEIMEMYQSVCLLEIAFDALSHEEKQVLEYKYIKQYPDVEAWDRLQRGKTWFYDRRSGLVETVAVVLGFLQKEEKRTFRERFANAQAKNP